MIPVPRVAEPPDFDQKARQPGNAWLRQNVGARRPRDYWSPFCEVLATGFQERCGYGAMYEPKGTVDHFRSWKTHPELAYEWSNYRFASQWLNSSKKEAAVLDPHEVGEGWFEILLPSLQLVLTNKVPADARPLAEATLWILPLQNDERVMRQRRKWYGLYRDGKLTLDGLRDMAPLIAAAVEKQEKQLREARRTA